MRNSICNLAFVGIALFTGCANVVDDIEASTECDLSADECASLLATCDAPGCREPDAGADLCPEPHSHPATVDGRTDCACDEFYQLDSRGRCAPDATRAVDACQLGWIDRSDGRGDPFEMLDDQQSWFFTTEIDDIEVELFPSDWVSFRARWPGSASRENLTVHCDVPVSWYAVARDVAIELDPAVAVGNSGILGSGKEETTRAVAHDALGGLVLSWNRRFFKRYEASLQWFLTPADPIRDLSARLRDALAVPVQQAIDALPILDLLERPQAPTVAWRAYREEASDVDSAPWVVGRREFANLRLTPAETPVATGSIGDSLTASGIWPAFQSSVWLADEWRMTECRSGTNAIRNTIADDHVRSLLDNREGDDRRLCIDLLWTVGSGWQPLVTTTCIEENGILGQAHTRALAETELYELGLPPLELLTCD